MTRFEKLMKEAKELEAKVDTDYVAEHADEWEAFDKKIRRAYLKGLISRKEFDELAVVSFYDYYDLLEA